MSEEGKVRHARNSRHPDEWLGRFSLVLAQYNTQKPPFHNTTRPLSDRTSSQSGSRCMTFTAASSRSRPCLTTSGNPSSNISVSTHPPTPHLPPSSTQEATPTASKDTVSRETGRETGLARNKHKPPPPAPPPLPVTLTCPPSLPPVCREPPRRESSPVHRPSSRSQEGNHQLGVLQPPLPPAGGLQSIPTHLQRTPPRMEGTGHACMHASLTPQLCYHRPFLADEPRRRPAT